MLQKLHKKEYEMLVDAEANPSSTGAEPVFFRLYQTGESNRRLMQLVQDGAKDSETLVADLLFSFLTHANKKYAFDWKQAYGEKLSIQGREDQVWPVREFDLMPGLVQISSILYPQYTVARPDKAKGAWLASFIRICSESALIKPLVNLSTNSLPSKIITFNTLKSSELRAEFPAVIRNQIATASIPSPLSVPAKLYTFQAWSRNRVPGGFFANRAMLLRFKAEEQTEAQSAERMTLPMFLRLTGLPDFAAWRKKVSAGQRSVPQWVKSVINAPFNKGGLFSVELDSDSALLKITKLFEVRQEEKKDESD